MADIDADLVVFALTVAIAQETYLGSVWDYSLDLNADFMFSALLLLVVKSIVDHFIVELFGHISGTTCTDTEWL